MAKKRINLSRLFFGTLLFCTIFQVSAVVITGTRVIYPAGVDDKFVQVTNTADFPNVVQVWLDSGEHNSRPDSAAAPFIVAPPVFRMEPKMGHLVRIVYDGTPLPQDRESLYYLNVLQIPPKPTTVRNKNQLNLLIRHRLKLFYRPSTIAQSIDQLSDYIHFKLKASDKNWQITVHNESGYYVSFVDAELALVDKRKIRLNFDLLEPYSSQSEDLNMPVNVKTANIQVNYSIINDLGGSTEKTYKL